MRLVETNIEQRQQATSKHTWLDCPIEELNCAFPFSCPEIETPKIRSRLVAKGMTAVKKRLGCIVRHQVSFSKFPHWGILLPKTYPKCSKIQITTISIGIFFLRFPIFLMHYDWVSQWKYNHSHVICIYNHKRRSLCSDHCRHQNYRSVSYTADCSDRLMHPGSKAKIML